MHDKKKPKNLRIRKVCIVGVIPSFAFQRAKYCALELHRKLPQRFPLPEIVGLLELDWSEKLQEWRQMLGREYWCLRRPVAVFFDNRFIGSDIELIKLTSISNILMDNIPRKDTAYLKQNFRKDYITYLKKSRRVYCYLDICIDDVYAGTLTFLLYSDLLPRTCENFKTLCLGSRGPLLSYKGSRIHRIVKKGWLQGGDIQYKTGGGGFSIFCDPLEDECYGISHDKRGILSMASAGRHKIGSQFFITLQPSKWMDTHFVAFGQLIEGVKVLKTLENLETFYECPINKVEIKNCGKLDLGDVEDIDVLYKEERLPEKKRKRVEKISEQIVKLVLEALSDALDKRFRAPDILADGDIPSKMNLQLYFQGFYSLPEEILEKSAAYLRKLRRELFRLMKPSATEIVESLMYDLQIAVLTRMTTLDDMRQTIGRDLYNKMIAGINLTLASCKKQYVRRLVNQITTTAENMVDLVTRKLLLMKRQSTNLKNFQEKMQRWVKSFVLQETYEGDNYFIAERPVCPPKPEKEKPKEGKFCCEQERKKKQEELKAKMRAKYTPEDICCLGSQLHLSDSEVELTDLFSTCRYDLKKVSKRREERMPLLDLIEISRFKLRWLRQQEHAKRPADLLCLEKKIRRWMAEVVYTSETSWLKDAVFPRDCRVLDHMEEVMYGAMTAGLLEMYYFMLQYLKACGGKRQQVVTKLIYPEGSNVDLVDRSSEIGSGTKSPKRVKLPDEEEGEDEEKGKEEYEEEQDLQETWGEGTSKTHKVGPEKVTGKDTVKLTDKNKLVPCPCGHPCCDCPFDPKSSKHRKRQGGPDRDREGDEEDEGEGGEGGEGDEYDEYGRPIKRKKRGAEDGGQGHGDGLETAGHKPPGETEPENPCESDETLVDLNLILAQKLSTEPEHIDLASFKWLKPYILEKGCDLKTEFATRVHNWMEGEAFNYSGFLSKHSLVTRASLLSMSLSLAELIQEENNLKTEIKDFIYDLWDLYFEEMFKEALLEHPPKEDEDEVKCEELEKKGEGEDEDEEGKKGKRKRKGEGYDDESYDDDDYGYGVGGKGKRTPSAEECRKLMEMLKDFDFDRFCAKYRAEHPEPVSPQPKQVDEPEVVIQEPEPQERQSEASTPRQPVASQAGTPQQGSTPRPSTPERPTELHERSDAVQDEGQTPSKPVKERGDAPRKSVKEGGEAPRKSIKEGGEAPRKSIKEGGEAPRKSIKEGGEAPRKSIKEGGEAPRKSIKEGGEGHRKSVKGGSDKPQVTVKDSDEIPPKSETDESQDTQRPVSEEDDFPLKEQTPPVESQHETDEDEVETIPETKIETPVKHFEQHFEEHPVKKKKSPIVVEELVDLPSPTELRQLKPYAHPFWVTFLTEMTKQALGAFAAMSRLPRRLYLKSDSEFAFEDKMKEWFEFNAFNPQPTKGREVMDFISLHHKTLRDLDDTARSFMKKKKYTGLVNRCTRFVSAEDVVGDMVGDVIRLSREGVKTGAGEDETTELFVSNMLISAVGSSKGKSESSYEGEDDYYSFDTDENKTHVTEDEENENL